MNARGAPTIGTSRECLWLLCFYTLPGQWGVIKLIGESDNNVDS